MVTLVVAPDAWAQTKYKTLYKFNSESNGYAPTAGVIFDQAGNLYGTTAVGGYLSSGAVFRLTPNSNGSWKKEVLHAFGGHDGSRPMAGLIFDQTGNLYGTTQYGGANQSGVVFKLTPNQDGSWTESVLYSFCALANCSDGAQPEAGLVFDGVGNLYGTTLQGGASSTCKMGCGTVFELTPKSDGTWVENVLYSFCSLRECSDGATPYLGSLIFDQAGNLYGTTGTGGNPKQCGGSGCGLVYQLAPNGNGGWTEHVLYRFQYKHGAFPQAGLIFDQAGNLYSTTLLGGARGAGVVFQLTPSADGSWKEKVLHSFAGHDGLEPIAGLILDQAGNLYGTTLWGGVKDAGLVFKLAANSNGGWRETVLHGFLDRPGAAPYAGVTFDAAGNLYGTTDGENSTTFGSVFEIMP